jgi:hypothetical protein
MTNADIITTISQCQFHEKFLQEDFKMHGLRWFFIPVFALVLAGASWFGFSKAMGGPESDEQSFTAVLSGDQMMPSVKTDATGKVTFQVKKKGTELYYKVEVKKIRDVMMAHIHMSDKGKGGPVVVWLYPPKPGPKLIPNETNGVLAEGTITKTSLQGPLKGKTFSDLIKNMKEGKTLVRVHTKTHMEGEIQGMIK